MGTDNISGLTATNAAYGRLARYYREWTIPAADGEERACDSVILSDTAVRSMGAERDIASTPCGSMVRAENYCDYLCF